MDWFEYEGQEKRDSIQIYQVIQFGVRIRLKPKLQKSSGHARKKA